MFDPLIRFIREQYRTSEFIPLHAPTFGGNEAAYVRETVDSTFVSSVGAFVDKFEAGIANYTGSPSAVATVNGTAALHMALLLAGVSPGDLVLTQSLTFVASCNAISYCGARAVLLDVDRSTLSLSPGSVEAWLNEHAFVDDDGLCKAKLDARAIRACLPMHTFGHPARLDELVSLCRHWHIVLVEDAAEALGSFYKGRHVGTLGRLGALSFNGNKIVTSGGGGMILAGDGLAARAKHLTTTAKQPHPYEFVHDEIAYNYRLPNINAALGCAQLERLDRFIAAKRSLASRYAAHLANGPCEFVNEPEDCRSNYWLNAVLCSDRRQRDALLADTNEKGVMTRPIWTPMDRLPMYQSCRTGPLANTNWLQDRIVNIPSSVPPADKLTRE